jgi:biopolymer transport protein ExbB/TolQ
MAEDFQAGADLGGMQDDQGPDPGADATDEPMTDDTQGTEPQQEDTFFDPAQLAPELQDQWKRMQASFTKRRQEDRQTARQAAQKAQLVDKFYNDRDYALRVVQQVAPYLGLQIVPHGGTPGPQGTPSGQTGNTQDLESELHQNLGSDLGFLAKPLASVLGRVIERRVKEELSPFEQQTRQQQQLSQQQEEDEALAAMDSQYPGWEQHQTQMQQLDAFLRSGRNRHPVFGTRQEALYKLVTGGAMARVDAAKAMQAAAKNRTTTGRAGRQTASNLTDTLRKANREQGWNQAWKLVADNLEELEREAERQLR